MPEALKNKEDLFYCLEDFYLAFQILYKNKHDLLKPIKISEILAYSQLFPDMDDDQMLLAVVITADETCLEHLGERKNG